MVKIFGTFGKSITKNNLSKLMQDMGKSFGFGKEHFLIKEKFGVGYLLREKEENIRKGVAENKKAIVCFSGRIVDYEKDVILLKSKGFKFDKFDKSKKYGNYAPEELVLNYYSHEGMDFIEKLNGVFVIVIYDKILKKLFIANDRFGMQPLYYYFNPNSPAGIVFASEIKAIISDKSIPRNINWDFWKDFFSYGFALGDKTPFAAINALPNASILSFDSKEVKITTYWSYDTIQINYGRSEEKTIAEGVDVLKKLFKRQTFNLRQSTVLLSGGYDSRCIAACIKRFTNTSIKAYTIAKSYHIKQTPFGDKDARYGQQVCNMLGIEYTLIGNHFNIYKDYFKEHLSLIDYLGIESIWIMPLIDEIKENKEDEIIFEGIAGDIFLRAGWLSIKNISDPGIDRKILAANLHKQMIKESSHDIINILKSFNEDSRAKIIPDDSEVFDELKKIFLDNGENEYVSKIFHLKNRTRNIISLASNNLVMRKSDVAFPFCDNEFLEFALSIPPKMKVRKNIYFKILKKAFPDVMNIPTTNDPKNIKEHFKSNLMEMGLEHVVTVTGTAKKNIKDIFSFFEKANLKNRLSKNPRDVEYLISIASNINFPEFIDGAEFIKNIKEHVANDQDPTYFVEPVLNFCIWYNYFMSKKRSY